MRGRSSTRSTRRRPSCPADEELRALLGDALLGLTRDRRRARLRETRWHEFLAPVEVASGARRLRVRPPWRPAGVDDGALEVVIDPGAQFGAGTHPTTQLCLELLLELGAGGGLCDWGAGSGILAVAAARLGFAPVDAVEPRGARRALIRRNAAANGVAVTAHAADLTAAAAATGADRRRQPDARRAGGGRGAAARSAAGAADRLRRADRAGGRGGGGVHAPRAGRGRAPGPRRLGGGRAGARVIRLAIRVDRAHAEAVLAELLELAPGGLEEREERRRDRIRDLRRAGRDPGAAGRPRGRGRRAGRRLDERDA